MDEIQVTIHTESDQDGTYVKSIEFSDHTTTDYDLIKAVETHLEARKQMLAIERAAEEAEYRNELALDPVEW